MKILFTQSIKLSEILSQDQIELIKNNKELIEFYLSTLIENKCTYLYWSIMNFKYRTLIFTNAKNEDKSYKLIKSFLPEMIIKILYIKNKNHWNIIHTLLKIFSNTITLGDEYIYNDIYVLKIKNIINYLKKIDYDLSKTEFVSTIFKSIYLKGDNINQTKSPSKLFCFIERDILVYMILNDIYKIYYSKKKRDLEFQHIDLKSLNYKNNENIIKEIHLPKENKIFNILLESKVHLISKKVKKNIEEKYSDYKYYINFIKDIKKQAFKYSSNLITDDFYLISGYPYVYIHEISLDKNNKKEVLKYE